MLFCLCLECVHHMAPGQPHCISALQGKEARFLLSLHEANYPVSATRKGLLAMRDQHPLLKLILLSLLSVSKVLSYLVLECIVLGGSFLATLTPRFNGQKCLESSPGIGNQCTVLCLTPYGPKKIYPLGLWPEAL